MKIAYHKETDSLYIHLGEAISHESEEVSPDVVIDYDQSGAPVGIDIQHASKHAELSSMTFENVNVA